MDKLKKVEEYRFGSPRWEALYECLAEIRQVQTQLAMDLADLQDEVKKAKPKPGRPKKNAKKDRS